MDKNVIKRQFENLKDRSEDFLELLPNDDKVVGVILFGKETLILLESKFGRTYTQSSFLNEGDTFTLKVGPGEIIKHRKTKAR